MCTAFPSTCDWPVPGDWPRWGVMWAVALSVFFACKGLTCWRGIGQSVLLGRRIGYLLTWPGMNPAEFFDLAARPARPPLGQWLLAAGNVALGLWLVRLAAGLPEPMQVGWVGIVGVVLVLHFGLFQLLAYCWRSAAVDARPIMDWPIAARTLSDFWDRRWNRAFHDLARRFVFRPLVPRIGAAAALWVAFLASGLVHDLVISLPAGGGYGLPTLYFLIQAAGLLAERNSVARRFQFAFGAGGRMFAAAVVLLPLPLLFHGPFITRVAAPLVQAIGGALCLPLS